MKASLVLLTVSIFASALVAAQNVRLCQKMTWWGWTRRYCHEINDPPMDQCINLDKHWNDATSKYTVENGCCAFYRHSGCRDRMFVAMNRGDDYLRAAHRFQLSSLKCARQGCIVGW
ncbi:Similar to hypothetical protein [Podospora anserina S mat+]; acc. no. XP_001903708 [Pyronema omphalodes CBS 100304]|uniref:Secreted protein n=1 Tax=Pyronema omphalodes (strain CBS 100304) TaxID=1076935 RepID=U4LAA2_PYROM|nr:Similar to hypothetical protein [Podospora anserina S mat+]; acc. no. XP_001903708 [Pyronema omphalodes CBS 100304]